jgi:hypothetical protein
LAQSHEKRELALRHIASRWLSWLALAAGALLLRTPLAVTTDGAFRLGRQGALRRTPTMAAGGNVRRVAQSGAAACTLTSGEPARVEAELARRASLHAVGS